MLNDMAKSLNTNRSELIRKAILHYRDTIEKEKLKIQIKKASMKVREESLKVSQEFDDTIYDGLERV
jgi:Arc/MetJ-type ribon-helix-helix transcriptional regulator